MSSTKIKNVLSIAGSDPSGGAGIQADLKTFGALGTYGMAAITSLTAQNTQGVQAVEHVTPDFLEAQLRAIFEDIEVDAVKIGMIGSIECAQIIIDILREFEPECVVLDPVLVATSGDVLVDAETIHEIKKSLFPFCALITPNAHEAKILAQDYAEYFDFGARHILIKGGDKKGDMSVDILVDKHGTTEFSAPRIRTKNTHGTGCTLSSAIAVFLAQGLDIVESINSAKNYVSQTLKNADALKVGQGHGPLHHFYESWTSECKNLTS